MKTYELVVPCHFGLEAVLKREIYDLGYEISRVEDGRVSFQGDAEAVCRANIFLRTAERVLIEVGRFRATTFEELFQGIKALPWEDYIPVNGKFWVKKASSIKSKLFSPSDIQSIAKKAMVERMKQYYDVEWFAEDGAPYPVRIFLLKDEVMVTLDTSGDSLHKRGYRTLTSKAPLTETLAASLLLLTPWRPDRILVDPFCGSGTFPIETLPKVYQMLYKYLPFPYGMNAMRETIGGLYKMDYWKDLGALGIYVLISLFIGLVVAIPFRKLNHIIEKNKEGSGVMI